MLPSTVTAAAGCVDSAGFSASSADSPARPSPSRPTAGNCRQDSASRVQPLTSTRTTPGRVVLAATKRTRKAGEMPPPAAAARLGALSLGQWQRQPLPSAMQVGVSMAPELGWVAAVSTPVAASTTR